MDNRLLTVIKPERRNVKMSKTTQLTKVEAKKIQAILDDPVKWAQVFVTIFDNNLKKKTPWIARWYQREMLQDKSVKKVARCGRRTGKMFCPYATN